MEILVVFFAVVVLLTYYRRKYNKYIGLKYRYKLYELRDELRTRAINKEINQQSLGFKIYDSILSSNINNYYFITLYSLIKISRKYKGSEEKMRDLSIIVNKELDKNAYLNNIDIEYKKATTNYLKNQLVIYRLYKYLKKLFGSVNISNNFIYSPTKAAEDSRYYRETGGAMTLPC